MSSKRIDELMKLIDSLPMDEREEFSRRYFKEIDVAFQATAMSLREKARARGFDDVALDQAIQERRYGR